MAIEAYGDWLDTLCWRCGSTEASQDSLGRLLCSTCRADLSGELPAGEDDPLRVGRGAYWEAHVMERCWRCLTESVDLEDGIGLCGDCRGELRLE